MSFNLLKISAVKVKELDTAIKSKSANGLVKTRLPYTKVRKVFTITTPISKQEELDELKELYNSVRTVTPFTWSHPTEKDEYNNPVQYNVRFTDSIDYEQAGSYAGYYKIEPFKLEEV